MTTTSQENQTNDKFGFIELTIVVPIRKGTDPVAKGPLYIQPHRISSFGPGNSDLGFYSVLWDVNNTAFLVAESAGQIKSAIDILKEQLAK